MSATRFAFTIIGVLLASTAGAQKPADMPTAQPPANPETIQIGLSTDVVELTADFSGQDLTIFGALENIDPLAARQGRYDVIVVLEGPARSVVVRRKSRVLGMWINTRSETFENVPVSYSLATTRMPQDITDPLSYKRLSLGADNIHLQPRDTHQGPMSIQEFTDALRERKKSADLYSVNYGGVEFLSQSLFRARLKLAPSVPIGTHKARAFLFRSGQFVRESSAQLSIRKAGFEQWVSRTAQRHGFLYGLGAVAIAMATGWIGSIVFRRS